MNNACRYCLLCPVCSLQMFHFPDFWGDVSTLSWSGGPTYVLLWFNRYIETQVVRVFHKLLVWATWKYLLVLRFLHSTWRIFQKQNFCLIILLYFFSGTTENWHGFCWFYWYFIGLVSRSMPAFCYFIVLCFASSFLVVKEGRPMGFRKGAALLGNLSFLGNLSLL